MVEPGHALALVLTDLERTDGRALIAAAVGDLVACGAWELTGNVAGRHDDDAPPPILAPCNRRPPAHEPLASIDTLLRDAPRTKVGGVSGRDPEDFAVFAGKLDGGVRALVDHALGHLVAAGRLHRGEPYALGAFRAVRHERTADGDAVLRMPVPPLPREAALARRIVADELATALAAKLRSDRESSHNGDNISAAIRYGGGL